MRLYSLLIILACFCSQSASAHALWIETNSTGKKGRAQEVRIYFGEFSGKDLSLAGKWFSDLAHFSLVAVAPDGTKTALVATESGDHYTASFTPSQDGAYTLVAHHIAKDVYKGMKLDYNSGVTVIVGNDSKGNNPLVNNNIVSLFSDSAFAFKHGKPAKVSALYDTQPAARQEVKVVAPNGWEKALYSNASGEVTFTPLWSGTYLAEYTYTDKTAGDHNGKAYTETKKVATFAFTVK